MLSHHCSSLKSQSTAPATVGRVGDDGTWLVWAATQRGHDHDIADYEIYMWKVGDPAEKATRLTFHSGNDRWPDIHLLPAE